MKKSISGKNSLDESWDEYDFETRTKALWRCWKWLQSIGETGEKHVPMNFTRANQQKERNVKIEFINMSSVQNLKNVNRQAKPQRFG